MSNQRSTSNQPTMGTKTAKLDLPEILFDAIKAFNFVESPLWTISKGHDQVKVELTFQLQPVIQQNLRKNKPKRVLRKTKPEVTRVVESRKPCAAIQQSTVEQKSPVTRPSVTSPTEVQPQVATTLPPPTLPPRKLPRLVSPEPSPVKTTTPRRESTKITNHDQFSIHLPDIEEGNYAMLPPVTGVKTFDMYNVEAVRTARGTNHYLLKRKEPFNVESATNDDIYATYDEINYLAVLVMPPADADHHHPEIWREWKTTFSRAEPVTDAVQSINMLNVDQHKFLDDRPTWCYRNNRQPHWHRRRT